MNIDVINLSKMLIRCPSVTPEDGGALGVLEKQLKSMGFSSHRLTFSDENTLPVQNLYARFGSEGPNFCFAGHTDVVPPGKKSDWVSPPFEPEVRDGFLFGRGAADMKCALAAMVVAVQAFIKRPGRKNKGSISFLITGDEEGPAINGTVKVLDWMQQNGETIDACIVGEPTNPGALGGMIKIGRRGSLNIDVNVDGTQGHAAYPHLADNPIHKLVDMMKNVICEPLDKGSEYFEPSDIQLTTFDVGNTATNVIPPTARARFNVRFNDLHSAESVVKLIKSRLDETQSKYAMNVRVSGESFITSPGFLSEITNDIVRKVTGIEPKMSTSGGTSDARFIKNVCSVIEFGLCNETAHKVNECANVKEIHTLVNIYEDILSRFFEKK